VTACIVTNRIIVRGLQKEDQVPRIAIPKREDAPAESEPILDNVDKMQGFVPNLHRLMSISPNALSGWATLMGSLAKTLDVKTRDGIALAVSEADGCYYCLAAHSYIAGNLAKIPADEIELNRAARAIPGARLRSPSRKRSSRRAAKFPMPSLRRSGMLGGQTPTSSS
jgi:AhpD family alkylhydroperoxidase